jgi:hypothetical protein
MIAMQRLSIFQYRVLDSTYNDCFPWFLWKEDEAWTNDNNRMACGLPDRFRCARYECVNRVSMHDTNRNYQKDADELVFVGCNDEFDCQHLREVDLSEEPLISYQEICDGHDIFKLFDEIRAVRVLFLLDLLFGQRFEVRF